LGTVQLKISISDELEEKLEAARKKHGKRTVNAIASEVVEDYLVLWDAVEERRKKLVTRQHNKVLKKLDQKSSR
jgi:hypothetical protein